VLELRAGGLSWEDAAGLAGYPSANAARHGARRYAAFDGRQSRGACRVCGARVDRHGSRGRLPEFCDVHAPAKVKRDRERRRRRG
jgi:hypothetical protein